MLRDTENHPFPGTPAPIETMPVAPPEPVKPPRQFKGRRQLRNRPMDERGRISPIGTWSETVSYSDIVKFLECQGKYVRWAEGDAPGERTIGDAIGQAVHNQIAKPAGERISDVATLLKSVPAEKRAEAAEAVKAMIKAAVAAQAKDEASSSVCEKEPEPIVWYNKATNTWWYAKPDLYAISRDERGSFLLIDDEKTGKARKRSHISAAFFMGYTAREAKALGFTGLVKTVVRYLRDQDGNVLETPHEEVSFISAHRLSPRQEQELQGIEVTIDKMRQAWESGKFELHSGGHCKGCPFRFNCEKNQQWLDSQAIRRADRVQLEPTSASAALTVDAPANDVAAEAQLEVA